MSPRAIAALLCLGAFSARAAELDPDAAKVERMENLRAEVASQFQLQAYDLLDELVYRWTQEPAFDKPTLVVLADVSVPIGFGSGLQALLENHFVSVLTKNVRANLSLAHCPRCMAVTVHSGPKGTVVARGVDLPETLAEATRSTGITHALFLDFEAEGASLVLRARVTRLEPALPIVYAKTLTTSTASPALLRSSEHLKSADEARKEYLDALAGRGLLLVPVRLSVRAYAANSQGTFGTAPFVWLSAGVELALSQSRAWTASFSAGISWAPNLHVAWMGNARVSRLLTGSTSSLTHPDVTAFVGASVMGVYGRDALAFRDTIPTVGDLVPALVTSPNLIFGAFQLGLEMRVRNRIAVGGFLEWAPWLDNAPAVGHFIDLGLIKIHTFGVEVSFCF